MARHGLADPGVLSPLLAWLRWRQAERLLRGVPLTSALDVGAGTFPAFLCRLRCTRRVGLERREPEAPWPEGIERLGVDLATDAPWPLAERSFDAVTLLAVLEHLPPEAAVRTLREARRVLSAGGVLVATVPGARADGILAPLARLGLASRENLEEHQQSYDPRSLRAAFLGAGFDARGVETGRFELGLNVWARARG
jgi:SAM-dependent methyltransferase